MDDNTPHTNDIVPAHRVHIPKVITVSNGHSLALAIQGAPPYDHFSKAITYEAPLDFTVAGIALDHAPAAIKEIVPILQAHPTQTLQKKEYLFVGPTGSGKKTIANAIAQTAGWSCATVSVSLFCNEYQDSAKAGLLRAVNKILKDKTKCVIVLDYLTLITNKRNRMYNDADASDAACTVFDMCNKRDDILVIGTTDDESNLATQVARRFGRDGIIEIELPRLRTSAMLLTHLFQNELLAEIIDDQCIENIARTCKNKNFRGIISIYKKAASHARRERRSIQRTDIDELIQVCEQNWYSTVVGCILQDI
ncbi:MAG: ATP-binding protein [Candidatus Dependentiae bacterium]|nr:ATP-binding protein [Candidatus Dependentiae bacterium]